MSVSFLYPSNPLDVRQVDDMYREEFTLAKQAGLSVHCIDIENIEYCSLFPRIAEDGAIIYRGYMLNDQSYNQLEKRFGSCLVTSKNSYLNAHYFPNWYKEIESLTIPSIISNESSAQEDLKKLNGKAFIKDYVKSLKTGKGSIVDGNEDLARALSDMKYYRGSIEGGIFLRKVVNFRPDSEIRFFVVNSTIFSPEKYANADTYAFVEQVVKQLDHKELKFYTVDIAITQEGHLTVIEVGDGQVSDYVGWELQDFIKVLNYFARALDFNPNSINTV
jgi:hypothetical protein